MRQEGTEKLPRKHPIIIDPEFQRKIIIHFYQYNHKSVVMTRKFHNLSEQVLKMMHVNKFGIYFSNPYQRLVQEIKRCMTCSLTLQTIPIQPKGKRIAGVAYGKTPYSHCAIDIFKLLVGDTSKPSTFLYNVHEF